MFVDIAKIKVTAGKGGNGAVSFRREIYVDKGGPDGGDGGKGGNVVFVADANTSTLVDFRFSPLLKSETGENGSKRRRNGRHGADLIVKVPVGTTLIKDGVQVADFTQVSQEVIVARGGDGGFGNAHFKSSVRQTPRVAEKGEVGDDFELLLELKLVADIGLVGLPNAGKSTFLSVVSNAKPEIADYPFTTLVPHLGVADIDQSSMLIADIPGLIEGAAKGKGLGHQFLRHVERTGVLLHLIDAYSSDIAKDYKTIINELKSYSTDLASRPMVVAITKIEGLDTDMVDDIVKSLTAAAPKHTKIMSISSQAHLGVPGLLRQLKILLDKTKAEKAELIEEEDAQEKPGKVIYTLDGEDLAWQVSKENDAFKVTGRKIEKFARRTDFDSYHGRQRLRDIMKKMGIVHELKRQGVVTDSQISFKGGLSMRFIDED